MRALLAIWLALGSAMGSTCDGTAVVTSPRPRVEVSRACLDAPLAPGCMP